MMMGGYVPFVESDDDTDKDTDSKINKPAVVVKPRS